MFLLVAFGAKKNPAPDDVRGGTAYRLAVPPCLPVLGDRPLRFRCNGRCPAQPTAQRGSGGGSGRVLDPVLGAGALAADDAPSLCAGTGKVPVVACF